jgi:hypothetical protein
MDDFSTGHEMPPDAARQRLVGHFTDRHTPSSRPLDLCARMCRRATAGWRLAELPDVAAMLAGSLSRIRDGHFEFVDAAVSLLEILADHPLSISVLSELLGPELRPALRALVRAVCDALIGSRGGPSDEIEAARPFEVDFWQVWRARGRVGVWACGRVCVLVLNPAVAPCGRRMKGRCGIWIIARPGWLARALSARSLVRSPLAPHRGRADSRDLSPAGRSRGASPAALVRPNWLTSPHLL